MKLFLLFICAMSYLLGAHLSEIREFRNSKMFMKNDEVTFITDADNVSFFIIGDWGGMPYFPYRTIIEQLTSRIMDKLSKTYDTKFQFALGDNFYFTGVTDVNDKRFNETFEKVFDTHYLRETPWFFVLGNHDHRGNASAQVEYTKKSKRWILPNFNYTIDVEINNGTETLITFVMVDTVLLCGTGDYEAGSQPRYESAEAESRASDHFAELEKRLAAVAATKVPYIIVSGHHQVWSVGEVGPIQCLVDRLRPLLHTYNVTAYMCGHDHNMQHLTDDYLGSKVNYIISGASNTVDPNATHTDSVPPGALKFVWTDKSQLLKGAFVVAQASRQNITLTYLDTAGKSLYQTFFYPRF